MSKDTIIYIDQVELSSKRILVRVDFDVSFNPDASITNDLRIKQNIPTLKHLLNQGNKLICVAKLNRPKERDNDPMHSLKGVIERLKQFLPDYDITLINDFLTEPSTTFAQQKQNEILVLENIRFYPQEKQMDPEFIKKLSSLADVYVNDAFAMAHRSESSIVGVTQHLPSYGGLSLKKEIEMIGRVMSSPQKPVVVILGGSKISTKINLVDKLVDIADYVLIGGGIANTFFSAQGKNVGKSVHEDNETESVRRILEKASHKKVEIILPVDILTGLADDTTTATNKKIEEVEANEQILDIGSKTEEVWKPIIDKAKTIIWNGPMGYFENPRFKQGTDFVYTEVIQNKEATSLVGGGNTVAAIANNDHLEAITHISTGGGAMLEYIEKGTLPGLEALIQSETKFGLQKEVK